MGKLRSCPRPQKEVVSRFIQVEPEFKPHHHLDLSHVSFLASHRPCNAFALPGNYLGGEVCTQSCTAAASAAEQTRCCPELPPAARRIGSRGARSPPALLGDRRALSAWRLLPAQPRSCFIQKKLDFSHAAPGTIAYHNRFPELNASPLERSSNTFL